MSLETWVDQENMGSAYKYACADCSRSNGLIQASTFKNLYGTTYAFCSYCITKPEILNPDEEMLEWLNRNRTQPVKKTRTFTEKVWVSKPNLREAYSQEDLKNCLCPFCLISDRNTEKYAETFTEYKLPACKDCNELIELQLNCLNNIEAEWLIDTCKQAKTAMDKNGFYKLVTKTITYYDY